MRAVLLLVCLALLAGCGRSADATGLDDDRFIDVMVQLRRAAERTRGEPDSFPPRRDRILGDAGVTQEQLLEYVETHGADIARMAAVWDSINRRLGEDEEDAEP